LHQCNNALRFKQQSARCFVQASFGLHSALRSSLIQSGGFFYVALCAHD
jgi:hypothetical protein